MSASETLCFTRIFGFLIGDLVTRNNEVWQLYIKSREIIHFLTSPTLKYQHLDRLRNLIAEHHTLYLKLFGIPLKPKFHMLIHYISKILQLGPCIRFSSMRFESKHRDGKITANHSYNRTNIIQTLSIKNQTLRTCSFINTCNLFQDVQVGPQKILPSIVYEKYFKSISDLNSVTTVSWVTISGTQYTNKTIILIANEDLPVFGMIHSIYKIDQKIFFWFSNYLLLILITTSLDMK